MDEGHEAGGERHDGGAAARALGERLRWVRTQQHRSLQDVEELSEGELKASVLGAYERGERAVSVVRLRSLATFYRVPVTELLPSDRARERPAPAPQQPSVVIDLVALEAIRDREPAIARYVDAIQARRGDWNGRVLTVRTADLDTLAAVADATPDALRDRLARAGVVR